MKDPEGELDGGSDGDVVLELDGRCVEDPPEDSVSKVEGLLVAEVEILDVYEIDGVLVGRPEGWAEGGVPVGGLVYGGGPVPPEDCP